MKTKTWIIFTELGINAVPYIFDSTNWDATDEEISLCIQEQIYGDKPK